MFRDDEDWREIESLLGKTVTQWGHAMGLVYSLPEQMHFENFAAIRLALAQLNGDGSRIAFMQRLIKHRPILFDDPRERTQEALAALKELFRIVPERDAIVHGIPVWSYKRDALTKEIIREGAYMVQQREWDDANRFVKVPEQIITHLEKLEKAHDSLLRVARPMLFEEWEEIFRMHSESSDS